MSTVQKSVFISYQPENRSIARELYSGLRQHGLNAFLDMGSKKDDFLARIAESDLFVLLLSPGNLQHSTHSRSRLRRELERAVDTKSHIVPVFVSGFDWKTEEQFVPKPLLAELKRSQPIYVEPGKPISQILKPLEQMLKKPDSMKAHSSTDKEWAEAKLKEDDLYTLLHAYVRKFYPSPDLMLYGGEDLSASELKTMIDETTKKLKTSYGLDLNAVVKHVNDLVSHQQYDEAISYIRQHAEKVEQAIQALG